MKLERDIKSQKACLNARTSLTWLIFWDILTKFCMLRRLVAIPMASNTNSQSYIICWIGSFINGFQRSKKMFAKPLSFIESAWSLRYFVPILVASNRHLNDTWIKYTKRRYLKINFKTIHYSNSNSNNLLKPSHFIPPPPFFWCISWLF